MKKMDVIITASSRPECLKMTMKSFLANVKYSGGFRFLLHEDCVYREMSDKVKEVIEKSSELFEEVIFDYPHIGLGRSLFKLLNFVKSEFIFYLQDDWYFERFIDLDVVTEIIKYSSQINQIWFNKNKTFKRLKDWEYKEYEFDAFGRKFTCCLNNLWCMLPGIWRTSFIKRKSYAIEHHALAWPTEGQLTRAMATIEQRKDSEFCRKAIGSYVWGKQGDHRYIMHLGDDLQMQYWQRKGGRPGHTNVIPEQIDRMHKHPDVSVVERVDKGPYMGLTQFNVWLKQGYIDISDYFDRSEFDGEIDWDRCPRWAMLTLEPTNLKQTYVDILLREVMSFADGYRIGLVFKTDRITDMSGRMQPRINPISFKILMNKRLGKVGFNTLKKDKTKLYRYHGDKKHISVKGGKNLVLGLEKPEGMR